MLYEFEDEVTKARCFPPGITLQGKPLSLCADCPVGPWRGPCCKVQRHPIYSQHRCARCVKSRHSRGPPSPSQAFRWLQPWPATWLQTQERLWAWIPWLNCSQILWTTETGWDNFFLILSHKVWGESVREVDNLLSKGPEKKMWYT